MLKAELDRIRERISDPDFLNNKGLSNSAGTKSTISHAEYTKLKNFL